MWLILAPLLFLAQDSDAVRERNQLRVADYKSLTVIVEEVATNVAGVTRAAIRERMEQRFRAAEIKPLTDASPKHFLHIHIHLTGNAFSLNLAFNREVSWTLPEGKPTADYGVVWSKRAVGIAANSSTYVLQNLDGFLDQFVTAYLKANQ